MSLVITLLVVYLHMQNTQANKDYLTKLYNRSVVHRHLQNLISHPKKMQSIGGILFDLNNFKKINDTYGHDQGDTCLRHFSRLLVDTFGTSSLLARYGGDEFIIIRVGVTHQELEWSLADFTQQLDQFNQKKSLPFCLSASAGIALYADTLATDSLSFIQALDSLMYEDKRAFHAQQTKGELPFPS